MRTVSFNQIASSEFLSIAFSCLGLKHTKSRYRVSVSLNSYIEKMGVETKETIKNAFDQGARFSIVINEWTSTRSRRYLKVYIVTGSSFIKLGLARCRGSMTAVRTAELVQVCSHFLVQMDSWQRLTSHAES